MKQDDEKANNSIRVYRSFTLLAFFLFYAFSRSYCMQYIIGYRHHVMPSVRPHVCLSVRLCRCALWRARRAGSVKGWKLRRRFHNRQLHINFFRHFCSRNCPICCLRTPGIGRFEIKKHSFDLTATYWRSVVKVVIRALSKYISGKDDSAPQKNWPVRVRLCFSPFPLS